MKNVGENLLLTAYCTVMAPQSCAQIENKCFSLQNYMETILCQTY